MSFDPDQLTVHTEGTKLRIPFRAASPLDG